MKTRLIVMTLFAMGVAACGGGGGSDTGAGGAPVTGDVSVAAVAAAAKVPAGTVATFTATVANAGPNAAQNLTLQHTLTSGYAAGTITCTASGGASCPATTGPSMSLAQLPVGGSLSFSIPVPVSAASRGAITSTLQVTTAGDPASANNAASATTTAEDPRNDSYKAYATDGRLYTLTVDFDARTYTMAGNGLNAGGSFSADGSGTTFTFAGNAKFRVAEDLLVGGFDFGSGVKSFIGARRFVTTLNEPSGEFNTLGLNFPNGAPVDSRIFTSRFINSTLEVCLDNVIFKITVCPAASVWTYALSISGDEFTGVAAAPNNDTIRFRVAKSGATLIYLRAGDASDGTGRRFRVAVPETNGLAGGTFNGASTLGAWGTATLTATTYSVTGTSAGGSPISDSATLSGLGPNGPLGIRVGQRTSDGASVFVMQNSPLAVLVGARGGPAAGYMEIGAP